MSLTSGAVVGTFTVVSDAPSTPGGHRQVNVACSCGAAPRRVRASLLRTGKVECAACGASGAPVAPEATGNAGVVPDALTNTLSLLSTNVAGLLDLFGRIDARLEALEKLSALSKPPTKPQATITHKSIIAGCGLNQPARDVALDASRDRALELIALPMSKRTPELKEELRERIDVERERLATPSGFDPAKHEARARSLSIINKLDTMLTHWENRHFDNGED
jgi:hypothetical protein